MKRKSKIKLVAFDMEGCIADFPSVWEILHRKWGTWESHGLKYWEEYLDGQYDYCDFARKDVSVWNGAPVSLLEEAVSEVPVMCGADYLFGELKKLDIKVAIITNGLQCLAERFESAFGFNYVFGNRLVIEDGFLTGEIEFNVPYDSKGDFLADLMEQEGLKSEEVAAVGDGPADLEMFRVASKSILFNPCFDESVQGITHIIREKDLGQVLDKIVI